MRERGGRELVGGEGAARFGGTRGNTKMGRGRVYTFMQDQYWSCMNNAKHLLREGRAPEFMPDQFWSSH